MAIEPIGLVVGLLELTTVAYLIYRTALGVAGLSTPHSNTISAPETRFLILILAHNEARVIGATVQHLKTLAYPEGRALVVTVADDCSDDTSERAQDAGAIVLDKPGPASGKGAAIRWALEQPSVREDDWDTLVILDADSRPRPSFLAEVSAAIANGAVAVQTRTESIPSKGWVGRAYALNTRMRNRLWHQARERAGFSAILTGAGVGLKRSLLSHYPFETRTVTEDLEYSALLTADGVGVSYLYNAVIDIEQPATLGSSVVQRVRWARGQLMTTLVACPALLRRALLHRDLSALDTAMYLAMPSLVPLQVLLMGWIALSLLVDTSAVRDFPGLGVLPLEVLAAALGLSFALQGAAMFVDRDSLRPVDCLSYVALMVTWMPLAIYAALTAGVRTWRPTPHGQTPVDASTVDRG